MTSTRPPIQLLHVDDDPMFLDLSKTFLEGADEAFEVDTVAHPDAVLPRLVERAYDAVVSDHDMPGQTGIELLRRVRETYPDLPFVLFTGKGSEEVASEAIAAGVSDYVQKGNTDELRLLANRLSNLVSKYRAEADLQTYAEQQRIIAELGRLALEKPVETLFSTVVTKVAEGLDVEYCKLLACRDDDELLLREGVGWDAGLVGHATVGMGTDSQAGYTLMTDAPVVVTNLTTDERFRGPPLLTEHGIVSGISAVIGGPERPWGVLGAHTAIERQFTDDDVTFVQSVASVLGAAIDRYEYHKTTKDQRERLSLLIEKSPLGIIQYDETLEIIAVNPKGQEILGYTESELRGETWEVLVTEDSYADVARIASEILADDGGYRSVNENVRKDGERIVCEWHNRVVTDDEGDVVTVFSLFWDATERERQRRDLEIQTDLFEKAQDIANVGAWEWDVRTEEGFWTPQTARIHGFDPDDDSSVERSLERFHPDDRPTVETAFQRAIEAGEAYDLELQLIRTDGEQRWVHTRGEPQYEDGELVRVRGTIQDVTDQKERELELAETIDVLQRGHEITTATDVPFETKLDRLLELGREVTVLPYGFLTAIEADADGETDGIQRIVHAVGDHDRLQTGASCPLEEAYCRKTIDRADLLAIHDAVAAGWTGDPAYEAFELRSYVGSKVFVEDGLYGTFCFAATEPRGEPFSEAAKTVVKLMGEWAGRELERDRAQALRVQNSEQLAQFASVVSHDLRSPLSVASGRVELAREDHENVHLEEAAVALDRTTQLIEELLSLAREESTELRLVALPEVATTAWATIEVSEAQLVIETERSVWAVPAQLRQLFRNLFQNAVEHGGDEVTVTVGDLGDGRGFYVADDGVGLATAEPAVAFETGYSTSEQGAGLGLSIVEDVVTSHGWTLRMTESDAGGLRVETYVAAATDR